MSLKYKKLFFALWITGMVFCTSCQDKVAQCGPVDYINWVNNPDNGLIVKHKSAEYSFSVQYRPSTLLALIETEPQYESQIIIDSVAQTFSGMQQFLFRVSLNSGSNDWLQASSQRFMDSEEQIKYLSFSMQNDFLLVKEQDTIDCTIFHFERDFGIRPFGTFLLGFPIDKSQILEIDTIKQIESFKVIYQDSAFDDKVVEFSFSSDDINKIPILKL